MRVMDMRTVIPLGYMKSGFEDEYSIRTMIMDMRPIIEVLLRNLFDFELR